ncbi:Hypothetical_protein [Hexamita inflata]|uniref:Hypothetical_protein n=1 Tax=Hexamita inflata TaxID=28002 RepID=A0ABP1GXC0_9EUKA
MKPNNQTNQDKKPAIPAPNEDITKIVLKDQQKFAQDYLFTLHLQKIYGEQMNGVVEHFERYKSKVSEEIIQKEIELTERIQIQNESIYDDQEYNNNQNKIQAKVEESKTTILSETEQQEYIKQSVREEEQVMMPTRNRDNINFTLPFQRKIDIIKKGDGWVGVQKGDRQVRVKSKILGNDK